MATLIFDIETSALPMEQFDDAQKEYLFRECQKLAEEADRTAKRDEILRQCSLWPFTAQVVCIAMVNPETSRGQVLFTSAEHEEEAPASSNIKFTTCMDESELLTTFWNIA